MDREQWLEARKLGVGGSETAALFGKSPYMTNTDLWELKTGRKKPEDISDKERVKYGNAAESILIQLFTLDNPEFNVYTGKDKNNLINPEYSFIRGSLDGILTRIETNEKGILETKTALINNSRQLDNWENAIPVHYLFQVLHYLLVKPEFSFAIVYAKLDFSWDRPSELRRYEIERADFEEDIKNIKKAIIKFWGYVERDERPSLLLTI